jgi:hypothetical protein
VQRALPISSSSYLAVDKSWYPRWLETSNNKFLLVPSIQLRCFRPYSVTLLTTVHILTEGFPEIRRRPGRLHRKRIDWLPGNNIRGVCSPDWL